MIDPENTTVGHSIFLASRVLEAAEIGDGQREAQLLMCHTLNIDRSALLQHMSEWLSPNSIARFEHVVKQRAQRVPMAHITGQRAFFETVFHVTPDVLDPRPDTEALVLHALKIPFSRILDLGTGTGCIAISLLLKRPMASGTALDVSQAALAVASMNSRDHGLADRLTLQQSDWFTNVSGQYDLIVSNPPYISSAEMDDLAPEVRDYEPRMALTDGADGLDAYRTIAAGVSKYLTPGGRVLLEIGPTQARAVSDMLHTAGLENITVHPDFDGRDRVVSAQMPA